jgi:hypothetical protein
MERVVSLVTDQSGHVHRRHVGHARLRCPPRHAAPDRLHDGLWLIRAALGQTREVEMQPAELVARQPPPLLLEIVRIGPRSASQENGTLSGREAFGQEK